MWAPEHSPGIAGSSRPEAVVREAGKGPGPYRWIGSQAAAVPRRTCTRGALQRKTYFGFQYVNIK